VAAAPAPRSCRAEVTVDTVIHTAKNRQKRAELRDAIFVSSETLTPLTAQIWKASQSFMLLPAFRRPSWNVGWRRDSMSFAPNGAIRLTALPCIGLSWGLIERQRSGIARRARMAAHRQFRVVAVAINRAMDLLNKRGTRRLCAGRPRSEAPTDAAHVVGQQRRRRLRVRAPGGTAGAYLGHCDAFLYRVEVTVTSPLYTPRE